MSLFPSWPQWRTLPQVLTKEEKLTILGIAALMVLSLGYIGHAFYIDHTVPVPDYGGEYREGVVGDLQVVSPIFLTDLQVEQDIAHLVFSGLMTYDTTGALREDLAEHIEITAEGKEYIATLRKNVLWHDGERFTADDVIFTFDAIQNPAYRSKLRTLFNNVSAEAIDEYTVKFALEVPNYLFLEHLTFGIMPEHVMRAIDPRKIERSDAGLRVIGTGPYEFSDLEKQGDGKVASYTLERNRSYYGKRPYLDAITFKFYPHEEDLNIALVNNEVDGISTISPEAADRLPAGYSVYRVNMPRYFALFLNATKNTVLADKNIRRALDHALDREALIDAILSGEGEATFTMFPPVLGISAPSRETLSRDAIERLLDGSGWKRKTPESMRTKTTTQGKTSETKTLALDLATSDIPELRRAATSISDELKTFGIEVTIHAVSLTDLTNEYLKPRKYDMLLFGEILSLTPNPTVFWHSDYKNYPGLNFSMYENKSVDALLEEIPRTASPESRKQKYEALAKIVADDIPAIFLYSPYYLYAVKNDIRDVEGGVVNLPSWRFVGIADWYRETARVWKRGE